MAQSIACPLCGHINPTGAALCAACGNKLPLSAQDEEDALGDGPRLNPILATSRMAPPQMASPSYAPPPSPMAPSPPQSAPSRQPMLFIVAGLVAGLLVCGLLFWLLSS